MNLCVLHAWTVYWLASIQKFDIKHLMFSPVALFAGDEDDELQHDVAASLPATQTDLDSEEKLSNSLLFNNSFPARAGA